MTKVNEQSKLALVELSKQGLTDASISRALGISRQRVNQLRNFYGIARLTTKILWKNNYPYIICNPDDKRFTTSGTSLP